jgi:hypothetical protein
MVVEPADFPVATPCLFFALLIDATLVLVDAQVAKEVRSIFWPLLKVPTAV